MPNRKQEEKIHRIESERKAEVEILTAEYHRLFAPATPSESFYVDTLIRSEWRSRQCRRLELAVWNAQTAEHSVNAISLEALRILNRLAGLAESIEAQFDYAHRQLLASRARRAARNKSGIFLVPKRS